MIQNPFELCTCCNHAAHPDPAHATHDTQDVQAVDDAKAVLGAKGSPVPDSFVKVVTCQAPRRAGHGGRGAA